MMQERPPVHRFASLPSTMDEAKRLARAGAPHGTAVVAEEQTGGRGQMGHAFASPKGGLYASVVLRDVPDPRLATLALGLATAETLEVAGLQPRLKWVNDVLVGAATAGAPAGRKVAGILVEGESTGARVDFLVAGIGINVNGTAAALPPDVRPLATTVETELGCESCIPDLETLLLDSVLRWTDVLRSGDVASVLEGWRARDAAIGRRVEVLQSDGRRVAGTARGIDADGHLILEGPAGREAVLHGSLRIL